MKTKNFDAKVKAVGIADGLEEGQFEAIVSTYAEDSYGDVVVPGAFKADLDRWAAKGDPLPVIWSHDWADPFSHLGVVLAAEERPEGLWVKAQIQDLDTNAKAAQVYRLMKGRRVTQFSFAYDVLDAGFETRDGREVYALRELKVHEVGPCLIGVNQETELLAVKAQQYAADAKAGRVLSQKNYDALREAHEAIGTVLAAATPEGDEKAGKHACSACPCAKGEEHCVDNCPTTKTSEPTGSEKTDEPSQVDEPQANEEEPEGANSEEPAVKSAPRRALAVALLTNLS